MPPTPPAPKPGPKGGAAKPAAPAKPAAAPPAAPEPEGAALYLAHAEVHMRSGDLGQAANCYEVALRFEQRSVVALCGLGRVALMNGKIEDAKVLIMKALAIDPDDHNARKLMGEVHAKSGRFDLAVNEFRKAMESADDERRRRGHGPRR
jgi:tetratricopeptide (TPR) repeat protein